MDLGTATATAATASCARPHVKLFSAFSTARFRGQRRRGRGTVPVTALGANTGHTGIDQSHGREEEEEVEAEKHHDDSATTPKHQLLLQQQEHNAEADATSFVGANVEEQLQASSSNSPSKPRRIALFVEPSPFSCVFALLCSSFFCQIGAELIV